MQEVWDKMTNEELCLEYQQTKREDLYEYMLQRNIKLAMHLGKRYLVLFPKYTDDFEHCMQIAIWRAIRAYNPEFDTKFSTILYYYVWAECHAVIIARHSIRLPNYVWDNLQSMKEKYPDRIYSVLSLDQSCSNDGDDNDATLLDITPDQGPTTEELVESSQMREILLKMINKYLKPAECRAIDLYFGLSDGESHTLQQVGDMYGMSRERIRQLICRGLKKLRKRSELFDVK